MASLVILPFAIMISKFHYLMQIAVLAIFFLFSVLVLTLLFRSSKMKGKSKDPSWIVIDEWVGMCLVFTWYQPTLTQAFVGFLLFRYFDIHKWGLVGYIDRKVKSGLGVIGDDCIAGLQACLLLHLFGNFYPW